MKQINLLVGASSGIAKELIELLPSEENHIIGTFNNEFNNERNNLELHKLDLSNPKEIELFVSRLNDKHIKIDKIFFIAAIPGYENPDLSFLNNPSIDKFIEFATVNCFGYVNLLSSIINLNLLSKNCKICFFSSIAGSISLRGKLLHNKPGGNLPYRLSKAALNCAVKNISYDLHEKYPEITVFSIHPGWLQNFSAESNLSVKESATRILKLIESINPTQTGLFLDSMGIPLQY